MGPKNRIYAIFSSRIGFIAPKAMIGLSLLYVHSQRVGGGHILLLDSARVSTFTCSERLLPAFFMLPSEISREKTRPTGYLQIFLQKICVDEIFVWAA